MHTPDLFADERPDGGLREPLGAQAVVLRAYALPMLPDLWHTLQQLTAASPFRIMQTAGGRHMSAALSSCGSLGWVSDTFGYRYAARDPHTGQPWPAMPQELLQLGRQAAAEAGFAAFTPDTCLINRYLPGARMGLHQDRHERDFRQPIVSVSLGLPAVFLFGGLTRDAAVQRVPLFHGDVVVWGGVDRMRFHGVLPVKPGQHPLLGAQRINLTLRQAG